MIYRLFTLIVSLILTQLCVDSQTIADLQKEKSSIEHQLQKSAQLLKKYQSQRSKSVLNIRLLDGQIASRQRLISIYNEEVNWLNEDISELQDDIETTNNELRQLKDSYANLIRKSYKNRQIYNEFSFFLGADSFNDAYRRFVIVKEYNKFRRNQGLLILERTKDLERKKNALETKLNVQKRALLKVEDEKKQLESNKHELNAALKGLQRKESSIKRSINKQKKALRKLENAIVKLINEAKNEVVDYSEFHLAQGKLSWPVKSGVIVSKFGKHQHPVLKYVQVNNNGVDIQSTVTNQGLVVFDGIVSRVVAIAGYNKTVIVRHGKYLTVYANLSNIAVNEGDKVKRGQLLGHIYHGDGDNSDVLHFEIWKENVKLNPEKWLSN